MTLAVLIGLSFFWLTPYVLPPILENIFYVSDLVQKWMGVIALLPTMVLWFILDRLFFIPAIDMTMSSKSIDYDFLSKEYAERFNQSNHSQTV